MYAHKINVQGTKNLIEVLKKQNVSPRIIYVSSVTVYGPRTPDSSVLTVLTPVNPSDVYSRTKIEVEELIENSGLPWVILRLTAVPSLNLKDNIKLEPIFSMPLDQKIEFLHTYDAGIAIANSVDITLVNKYFLIGGGKSNQFNNKEFLSRYFKLIGLGKLPINSFKKPKSEDDWYYTHWMETAESQKILDYQKHTFEDFLNEFKNGKKILIFFITLFRPFIKILIKRKSPYTKIN